MFCLTNVILLVNLTNLISLCCIYHLVICSFALTNVGQCFIIYGNPCFPSQEASFIFLGPVPSRADGTQNTFTTLAFILWLTFTHRNCGRPWTKSKWLYRETCRLLFISLWLFSCNRDTLTQDCGLGKKIEKNMVIGVKISPGFINIYHCASLPFPAPSLWPWLAGITFHLSCRHPAK